MSNELKQLIYRWALANAVKHDGNANINSVVGKLIAERSELKDEIKKLRKLVEETIEEINKLTIDEQKIKLEKLGHPGKSDNEKEGGLPELPDLKKYNSIVTRFAPNPNGPLHLGHVRTALLSHEYARKHDGEFILRFEDTNPANAREDMYDLIRMDLEWLGIKWDKEFSQSNRLEKYYEYAFKLLRDGHAYVCTCRPSEFRKLRDSSEPCTCRQLESREQLDLWRGMLEDKFNEGDAVVRIKTNLNLKNPALRDWPALRISKATHPKVGRNYRVWPLYNFSVSIDDHEMGVTHVIRGKEHEVNEQRQKQLYKYLNWVYPTAVHHGRLSISGVILSKTKVMKGIKEGKFNNYNDVRLGTISTMRRRGFVPEAIKNSIIRIGVTPVDSTLSMDTLATENRRIIDEHANRYFFVPDPIELNIQKTPEIKEAKLRIHPDHPERGDRVIPLKREDNSLNVRISSKDFSNLNESDVIRLKDLLNIKLVSIDPPIAEFESFELIDVPKIQWISASPIPIIVLKPDGTHDKGLTEPEVSKLESGKVIQFERYGFVRIEEIDTCIRAVFTHK